MIVGQKTMVERLLVGPLADGHVPMEGRARPRQDAHGAHARDAESRPVYQEIAPKAL